MYITFFYLLFMFIIPRTFKNAGIQKILDGSKQGVFLILFAKILWWYSFVQIIIIWFNIYLDYVLITMSLVLLLTLYRDKKYLLPEKI